jgi:hypothetical protein
LGNRFFQPVRNLQSLTKQIASRLFTRRKQGIVEPEKPTNHHFIRGAFSNPPGRNQPSIHPHPAIPLDPRLRSSHALPVPFVTLLPRPPHLVGPRTSPQLSEPRETPCLHPTFPSKSATNALLK